MPHKAQLFIKDVKLVDLQFIKIDLLLKQAAELSQY